MASYTFVKTINDSGLFIDYVQKVYPSLQAVNIRGPDLIMVFSAALSGPQQTALTTIVTNYCDPNTSDDNVDPSNISMFNSTSVALTANANWLGQWEDVSRYTSIRVTYSSNVASATSGVVLQFGISAAQVDISDTYTLDTAGASYTQIVNVLGRYFRVSYTNGASAQTTFYLSTLWSVSESLPLVKVNDLLMDQTDCLLTRSIMCGRTNMAQFNPFTCDEQNQLRVTGPTSYERSLMAQSTALMQISFVYGNNPELVSTAIVAGGLATNSLSRAVMSSGAAINSSATMSSIRYCRTTPGDTIMVVVSCAFTVGRAGNTQLAGVGNATNGLFFGYNGTAFGVAVRSNGTTTWTPQASFNIDTLDGAAATSSSGIVLAPQFGNTYVIKYGSVGYGSATFMVLNPYVGANSNSSQLVHTHRVSFGNTSTSVGLLNPQFPIMISSANTTNNTAMTVSVASIAAYTDGEPLQAFSMHSVWGMRTTALLTFSPCITLQNKTTFNGFTNTSTAVIREFGVSCRAGNRTIIAGLFLNPTLSALTYTDVSTTTSAISYSTTAIGTMTAGTGTLLYTGVFYGATDHTWSCRDFDIIVNPGSFLCLATAVETATSQTITCSMSFCEFL
jgi:hypothetical protein